MNLKFWWTVLSNLVRSVKEKDFAPGLEYYLV